MNTAEYYDKKWEHVIKLMPRGGDYRLDMRQGTINQIKKQVPKGSKTFDFACGLGLLDIQLEEEKECTCYGCDFSAVAVEYVNMNIKRGEFRHTDRIFGTGYDFIFGVAYLEHTVTPRQWIDEMLERTENLIITIPNNFRQVGEHSDMQWSNIGQFFAMLEGLNFDRVDDYSEESIHVAWQSPIFLIKKENSMVHPSYVDSLTGEDKKKAAPKAVEVKIKKAKPEPVEEKPKKKKKKDADFDF